MVPVGDPALLQPVTRWLVQHGRGVPDEHAERLRGAMADRMAAWFDGIDVLLTPTTPSVAPRVGMVAHLPAAEQFHALARYGWFTALFNLTGQPAVTIPAGLSTEGLPVGVQIAGGPFADALVLAVARQVERALPWSHRDAFS